MLNEINDDAFGEDFYDELNKTAEVKNSLVSSAWASLQPHEKERITCYFKFCVLPPDDEVIEKYVNDELREIKTNSLNETDTESFVKKILTEMSCEADFSDQKFKECFKLAEFGGNNGTLEKGKLV